MTITITIDIEEPRGEVPDLPPIPEIRIELTPKQPEKT